MHACGQTRCVLHPDGWAEGDQEKNRRNGRDELTAGPNWWACSSNRFPILDHSRGVLLIWIRRGRAWVGGEGHHEVPKMHAESETKLRPLL